MGQPCRGCSGTRACASHPGYGGAPPADDEFSAPPWYGPPETRFTLGSSRQDGRRPTNEGDGAEAAARPGRARLEAGAGRGDERRARVPVRVRGGANSRASGHREAAEPAELPGLEEGAAEEGAERDGRPRRRCARITGTDRPTDRV